MQDVLRFWIERGVDGFRARRDRPAGEGPGAARRPAGDASRSACRCSEAERARRSLTPATRPGTGEALAADPRGGRATRFWWARSTCRAPGAAPYLEHLDRCLRLRVAARAVGRGAPARGRSRRRRGRPGGPPGCCRTTTSAGSLTRFGPENARAAAVLLLTLPGNGVPLPGRRDRRRQTARARAPPATAPAVTGSATRCSGTAHRRVASPSGEPWLPLRRSGAARTSRRSATTRARCSRSCASSIRLRRSLPRDFRLLEAPAGVVAYARGDHVVALNTTAQPLAAPRAAELVIETTGGRAQQRSARGARGGDNGRLKTRMRRLD